ncbi:uncharacterized protein F4822DRAFT_147120 [Hypoxylon trugodes]|uniref:uncharacterized protein n=1 Tax=Hypoxylon trugodes TaxID=326681 RepID=UPI00218D09B3|nr:uncharacterized protein F4822DRAFT_147120 [Hypoxylon trugodes]KAI1392967.1 hypothetical protein F4822DRAFT_147120 [Hypoxylon trugodes]
MLVIIPEASEYASKLLSILRLYHHHRRNALRREKSKKNEPEDLRKSLGVEHVNKQVTSTVKDIFTTQKHLTSDDDNHDTQSISTSAECDDDYSFIPFGMNLVYPSHVGDSPNTRVSLHKSRPIGFFGQVPSNLSGETLVPRPPFEEHQCSLTSNLTSPTPNHHCQHHCRADIRLRRSVSYRKIDYSKRRFAARTCRTKAQRGNQHDGLANMVRSIVYDRLLMAD